jgi:hypothetical protein
MEPETLSPGAAELGQRKGPQMRLRQCSLFLPVGLVALLGCGSGPALLSSAGAGDSTGGPAGVLIQAAATQPSITLSRGSLSTRTLPGSGGAIVVGATVALKNLSPSMVSVVATAVDGHKNVVATQAMSGGDKNIWRTPDPGLTLPPNFTQKPVSYTINVLVSTTTTPSIKKSLKVGTVSVAKSVQDPNLPPPPPF